MQIGKDYKILLAPISLASIRKLENTRCQKGLGETGAPMPSWWDYKLTYPFFFSIVV